jgi:hypothetical protein
MMNLREKREEECEKQFADAEERSFKPNKFNLRVWPAAPVPGATLSDAPGCTPIGSLDTKASTTAPACGP